MHLQVRVFNIDGQVQSFTLDGGRKRFSNVEVQRVAKLVRLGSAAGFDAGSKVARIMASEARTTERAQQVTQGFEAEEVQALVRDLKARLLLCFAGLAGRG